MKKRKEDRRTILLCSLATVAKQEAEEGPITRSHHLPGEGGKTHSSGQAVRRSEALGLETSNRHLDFRSRGEQDPRDSSVMVGRGPQARFLMRRGDWS